MLSVKGVYQNGKIKFDRKIEVGGEVPVIVTFLEEPEEENVQKYDFSDIVGKLKWKGDAVAEQRAIRDEW